MSTRPRSQQFRSLTRLRWLLLCAIAVFVVVLMVYNQLQGMSAFESLFAWLAGIGGAVVLVELSLRYVMRLHRDLQSEMNALEQVQTKLADAERRYQLASQAGRSGAWDWDLETDDLYIDPLLKSFLGYTDEEIPNRLANWHDLVHPDDLPKVQDTAEEHISGDSTVYEVEHRMLRKDGSVLWFLTRGTVVRDEADKPVRMLGTSTDITSYVTVQAEHDELQRRLLEAQKSESLMAMAAGVAHDFNNILQAINGHADLLLEQLPEDSPFISDLSSIRSSVLRAKSLTNQMLHYAGGGSQKIRPLNISELIGDLDTLLLATVSKKIKINYNLATSLPVIKADESQLEQVIMALVVNADEAMGDEPGAITLTTGTALADSRYLSGFHLADNLEEGEYVTLMIEDTGCGMDATARARMFDPFFSTKFIGRGLGLASVLGIVRAHGGAIRVDSEVGRGTVVRLLLPIAAEQPEPSEAPTEQLSPGARLFSGLALVVDDEEAVRVVAMKMLEKIGFSVLTANDGREALEVFREHADDLAFVLLDVTMPEMGGVESLAAMRRINPNVRVVLSSGYNEETIRQRFEDTSPVEFIQKPYLKSELVAKLTGVSHAQDVPTEGAASGPATAPVPEA